MWSGVQRGERNDSSVSQSDSIIYLKNHWGKKDLNSAAVWLRGARGANVPKQTLISADTEEEEHDMMMKRDKLKPTERGGDASYSNGGKDKKSTKTAWNW